MAKTTKKTTTKTTAKKNRNVCASKNAHSYGEYYWLVQLQYGRQWIHADRVEIVDGNLILLQEGEHGGKPNAMFAAGTWLSCHPATVMDGDMMAVAHVEFDNE